MRLKCSLLFDEVATSILLFCFCSFHVANVLSPTSVSDQLSYLQTAQGGEAEDGQCITMIWVGERSVCGGEGREGRGAEGEGGERMEGRSKERARPRYDCVWLSPGH